VRIGAREVGPGQPPVRLASAGTAHEGDAQLGYKLVETAGAAGADAVVLARGALSERDFTCVLGHAGHVGLAAVGIVTREEDVAFFDALDIVALRIVDSGSATLLESAARTRRPLLLSPPDLDAAEREVATCRGAGAEELALLAPNPRMMKAWQAAWPGMPIGRLGEELPPDELQASHAALIETEHRLPVSSVPRRNRP
jgi:sialic acid synthase SpsE